jgi:predicted ribosome quality control (RQC) complex YloA/Tae2 family protein
MYFDALTMASVADELRAVLLDGRVQRVLLPDDLSLGLEIYGQGTRRYLLASAHAELGRVLLSSEKLRRGVERETGMLLLLRKYVRGAILSAIEQPPFERVLRLEFDHPEWGTTDLMVEIMGRHSNLILVDPGRQVLDAVKRVSLDMSPHRPVQPNRPYTPPPAQSKLPPPELSEARLAAILAAQEPETQVWQALVRGVQGMSPLLAREISHRALGYVRITVGQIDDPSALLAVTGELFAPLATGRWQPSLAYDGEEPVAYAPYLLRHRDTPRPAASISQAIELYTAAAASADPYAGAKRPVREAIAMARSRLVRRREALERARAEAGEADQWRQWGEWILAYAHTITAGQRELLAETGDLETLRIPLDPDLSPADNAQAYFARYRKAQRAAAGVPERLEEVDLGLRDLEQLETDLELAASRPEVDEVRAALVEAGHVRVRRKRERKVAKSEPLSLPSPDGLNILVGRNSRQNDDLTFRRASSSDWWFHARGVPGSHVIVRGGGEELPRATVRRAAELAAHFSRAQRDASVVVDYTQRRHVRRIPRAAPGLVHYSQERSIRVAPLGPQGDEASGSAADLS